MSLKRHPDEKQKRNKNKKTAVSIVLVCSGVCRHGCMEVIFNKYIQYIYTGGICRVCRLSKLRMEISLQHEDKICDVSLYLL